MTELVTIILVLATFILLAVAITRAISSSEDKEAELLCHDSVALRAATQFNIGEGEAHLGPLLCKTIDKKIKGNKEQLKSTLAYMMARCWWLFNEARQDDILDDAASISEILGFKDTENNCFLCYTAAINQEKMEGEYIKAEEMMEYLITEQHPKIKGLRYIDYFQEYGGPGTVAVMNDIRPEQIYGILFMARNKDETSWTLADTFAVLSATAAGISCVISFGITCAVIAAAGATYLGVHGANALDHKKIFYNLDRPLSMVVLDDLESINRVSGCRIMGDVAGK